MNNAIKSACSDVLARIRLAEARSAYQDRGPVTLICVSKKQPVSAMQALIDANLFAGAGPVFGENYVQEFEDKQLLLDGPFAAHCIGNLQSNKVKKALRIFDVIETVDSEKLAAAIDREAHKTGRIMPVFLQVNISRDNGKAGFLPESLSLDFVRSLNALENLRLIGLMTVTRFYEEPEAARPDFIALRELRDSLQAGDAELPPLLLSMGMSADFEIAIEEGANLVRVGSAIFGERAN